MRTSRELTARILHVTARHFMLRSACKCHLQAIATKADDAKCLILLAKMVLPDRIELSTSPLPMECSTTELRQHALGTGTLDQRIGRKRLHRAGRSLPQG